MMVLEAKAAAFEELGDVNTLAVVFAENSDGSGERLELQRAMTFDAQDRKLGQDTYCLCVASGATCYGGVRSWRLDDSGLDLELTRAAAGKLGIDTQLRVELRMKPAQRAKLLEGLRRVLVEAREAEGK
jgi:hypothetical protein